MRKWLVPALLLIGSSLVVISIWSPKSQKGRGSSEDQIAFVLEKTGEAKVANNEMPEAVALKVRSSLNIKDVITTDDNSDVEIQWKNEGQFRVLEKSEVLLDQLDNGQFLVVVRSGDLYVEKFGSTPFWIRKDGQMLSASDFAASDKSKLSKLKEPLPAKTSNDNPLSQADIETLLNAKKTDFFKCYGQVLQRNAQAQGSVLISFTILNQGQTTKVEVSKSDIADTHFKACLTEVVSRTQFKSFSGAPITTVFPLKFE